MSSKKRHQDAQNVPAESKKRAKIAVACVPCRARKVRCDGQEPECGPCSRRIRCRHGAGGDECSYPEADRTQRYIQYLEGQIQSRSNEEFISPDMATPTLATPPGTHSSLAVDSPPGTFHDLMFSPSKWTAEPAAIPSVGNVKESTDFLHQLRYILETDPPISSQGLSMERTTFRSDEVDCVLPVRSVADRLLRGYWDGIHPFYPFILRKTFESQYQSLWMSTSDHRPLSPTFHSLLNMVFAVASQLELDSFSSCNHTAAYFDRARASLRFDPCELPSLMEVQVLLLMGLHQIGSGRLSHAKRVLDFACCSIQSLKPSFERGNAVTCNPQEHDIFPRVWHGCYLLCCVVTSPLGRSSETQTLAAIAGGVPIPVSQQHSDSENLLGSSENDCRAAYHDFQTLEFYGNTLRLNRLLRQIHAMWSRPEEFKTSEAQDPDTDKRLSNVLYFDRQLTRFWKSLPTSLQSAFRSSDSPERIRRNQSCILRSRYLYTRIILLRPLLSAAAISADKRLNEDLDSDESSIEDVLLQKLMLRCVASARELLQVMNQLQRLQREVPLQDYYNACFVYTAATVISEARKCPAISMLVGQSALTSSMRQGLDALERTSKPKSQRCALALRNLCQHYSSESDASLDCAPTSFPGDFSVDGVLDDSTDDYAMSSLTDLQEFMLLGADIASGEPLDWVQPDLLDPAIAM